MFFFLGTFCVSRGLLLLLLPSKGVSQTCETDVKLEHLISSFLGANHFFMLLFPRAPKHLHWGTKKPSHRPLGGGSGCQTWVEIMEDSLINSHASSCNHAKAIFIVSPQKKGWKWLSIFWKDKFILSKNSEGKKRSASPSKTQNKSRRPEENSYFCLRRAKSTEVRLWTKSVTQGGEKE